MERSFAAIVIGVSAGAVDALSAILPLLPENYALPVIIVVHLPHDKKSVMAQLFQTSCKLNVKEAEDKEAIVPGTVYFAPPDYHLLVEANKYLSLSSDEPVLFSRPAIDVLFETAADAYGKNLIGIILTGASKDGSAGVRTVHAAGGLVLVQQPENAYARTMPEAAIQACPNAQVMRLEEIALLLLKIVPL